MDLDADTPHGAALNEPLAWRAARAKQNAHAGAKAGLKEAQAGLKVARDKVALTLAPIRQNLGRSLAARFAICVADTRNGRGPTDDGGLLLWGV